MEPAISTPGVLWCLPFLALLLSIAIFPMALPGWWESNRNKLVACLVLGAPVLVYYLLHDRRALLETGEEFVSFAVVLIALFLVAGGVLLTGDLAATPLVNTAFLAAGAVLASFIGTTGASLLLIRPLLETNSERLRRTHTLVFFTFLVGNIGGLLTPLGDPPLFVGYLEGVPFTWTLGLLPHWLFATGILLAVYFVWDTTQFSREPIAALRRDRLIVRPLRLAGRRNLLFLGGIILAVAFLRAPLREAALLLIVALSLWTTPKEVYQGNRFSYAPIVEVIVLFFGIFLTMIPALALLRLRAPEFGIQRPWHFFWATGGLSSFLDNTPTYLAFLNLARGLQLPPEIAGVSQEVLRAISAGAVFMGANTYIGNAPNFMIRSVAEQQGVRMPNFFGYMAYSCGILIPLFLAVTWLFF